MISERAKESLGRIFSGAARSRLPARDGDPCEVVELRGEPPPHAQVVVLTISSMQFRLLLLLHFDDDAPMRDYYVGEAERTLTEAFMEVANLCCGAMNQQLVQHFADLGMSTPYALSSACVPYLVTLKPNYVARYDVTINGAVRVGATLCVCASAPIDFDAGESVEADSGGELELF
ncbi:hypothetical protein [Paraburkholderia caballeronis]|uniref:Chemotaxis protein CheX n=1 Tax=Paraburkholderia caballeronis TaxID=416943 RepID=A0A1H7VN94_9BURK|nr:hypothetical protein [Paraburkholderia caballeronis]PXW14978.1 hypothetical protein C7403_12639 [Paraburkholderia caballeronis]PXW93611.1 hypothetical protein C7407_12639 [Paraburkholderia caballeronis]RAJ88942.1 hypothetical protein C7409_12639 [Paraburkholderia caballeronis]SED95515.1 hypothetical protein SAMN05445871_4333 [Paraburkholderia caballeronis]SEM10315.1 hypothetical protein SAMN05192542_12621 [Paraburkholderia caballeronis]